MNKKPNDEVSEAIASDGDNAGKSPPKPSNGTRPLGTVPFELEVFYDNTTKDFWMSTRSGSWIRLSRTDLKKHLIHEGLSGAKGDNEPLSEVDLAIVFIQEEYHVWFVGALAGHRKGLAEFGSTRALITSEPVFIQPKEGDWSLLQGLLERFFGPEQLPYFYGWVKMSLQMYASRRWMAGQALVLCGEPGAGKNLICSLLGKLFGGRMPGKPYRFMTGRTEFNSDFFGAEFLTIEDEAESTSIQARRAFGAELKIMAANKDRWFHRKGQEALSVWVCQRIAISLNPEPDRLMVLPPIESDVEDKIMLFKVFKHDMPMSTNTPEEQKVFWDALEAQLPAFVYFLQQWQIPAELRSPRFGVKHYHHPELLSSLQELSPEQQLLELIDQYVFTKERKGRWTGRARDMEAIFKGSKDLRCVREAEQLLKAQNSCGRYLGRLEKLYPDRFSHGSSGGITIWTVLPLEGPDLLALRPRSLSQTWLERLKNGEGMPGGGPS